MIRYKVYMVLDSALWVKMRHFRFVMVGTCILLDIINIYWFKKMFHGAVVVFQCNWQYYEKHHKTQQLEMLVAYKKQMLQSITVANNILRESTKHGFNKISSRFTERNNLLPKILADLINRNTD